MGIGAWVAGTGVATAIGSMGIGITATMVGAAVEGAIIGAVIGGLSSAIMGGDIMQGVLLGGLGGAVMGGITGYLNPSMYASGDVVGSISGGGGVSGATEGGSVLSGSTEGIGGTFTSSSNPTAWVDANIAGAGTDGISSSISSSTLQGTKEGAGSSFWANVGTEAVKGGVQYYTQNEAAKDAAEQAEKQRAEDAALAREKMDAQLEATGMTAGASMYGADKQLEAVLAKIAADKEELRLTWAREDAAKAKMAKTMAGLKMGEGGRSKTTGGIVKSGTASTPTTSSTTTKSAAGAQPTAAQAAAAQAANTSVDDFIPMYNTDLSQSQSQA